MDFYVSLKEDLSIKKELPNTAESVKYLRLLNVRVVHFSDKTMRLVKSEVCYASGETKEITALEHPTAPSVGRGFQFSV